MTQQIRCRKGPETIKAHAVERQNSHGLRLELDERTGRRRNTRARFLHIVDVHLNGEPSYVSERLVGIAA